MQTHMDRISRLPDEVICHILSFLPTKHAVATSVLSSRWVNLWSFVPIIDLDDSLYPNPSRKGSDPMPFINFLDRVSSLNQSQTIAKFRLHIHDSTRRTSTSNFVTQFAEYVDNFFRVIRLIQNVFSRNLVEIDVEILPGFPCPCDRLKIPHSQSLKVLKVESQNHLSFPVFPGCFPSLRVFDVDVRLNEDDVWITNLFTCLPALEKLRLVGELAVSGDFNFNIGGPALKHLELDLILKFYDYDECDAVVVIDASKLDYLKLQDEFLGSYLVKNKPAISEVRLDIGDYDREFLEFLDVVRPTRHARFTELLLGLVNTKFISVSATTLKVVSLQRWNMPVLPYVTKLELDVGISSWRLLPRWLQSCPNLKVLSLNILEERVEEFKEVVPDVVPTCLSLCVKEIEIKRVGKVHFEKMLIYLLNNAKVLDKFKVDSRIYIKDGFWKAWVDMCQKSHDDQ